MTNKVLVTDRELAFELNGVKAKLYKRAVPTTPPRVGFFDLKYHGDTNDTGLKIIGRDTQLTPTAYWGDPAYLSNRIGRIPPTIDEAAESVADAYMHQLRAATTRRAKSSVRARRRIIERNPDGTVVDEPIVHVFDQQWGGVRPVGPDEPILPGHQYVDADGKDIPSGSLRYFDKTPTAVDTDGEVMWELVGPMLEDRADQLQAQTRFLARETGVDPDAHIGAYQDGAMTRWYRSRHEHVGNIEPGELPDVVVGESLQVPKKKGAFERLVAFGFDTVIGPSIDALVRKPMARHYFAERYRFSLEATKFLRNEDRFGRVLDAANRVRTDNGGRQAADRLGSFARHLGTLEGDARAARWTNKEAIAFLRGHTPAEIEALPARLTSLDGTVSYSDVLTDLQVVDPTEFVTAVRRAVADDTTADDFIADIAARFDDAGRGIKGSEVIANRRRLASAKSQTIIAKDPLLSKLTKDEWTDITLAQQQLDHLHRAAGEYAAEFAIADMLPYIDSHEVRSQFAEGGRGFLPFWYAEENFMRRWALTATQHPEAIRKIQLTYAGLKSGGVIRTDESGRDWFVIPGSTALIEAVSKVPGLNALPVGAVFQTPTDAVLPGLNSRFGSPALAPIITVPLDVVSSWAPELAPLEQALVGDIAGSRSALEQLFPTTVTRILESVVASDGSARYNSAMMTAIAEMEATGQGLRDDATTGERDEYMRNLRSHARTIVVAQAMMGFFSPGPPSQLTAGEGTGFAGVGTTVDAEAFSDEYRTLISNMGIDAGTRKYLELHPDANPHDLFRAPAFAYTVGRTESKSGAPTPVTTEATAFYLGNRTTFDAYPNAAPWLLPGDNGERRRQYATDAQTLNDLRRHRSPEEFLNAVKYKEASGFYFDNRQAYLDEVAAATALGDREAVRSANNRWSVWSATYKAQHPIFAQQLESGDGRDRRRATLAELRLMLDDPLTPDAGHLVPMRQAVELFDGYRLRLADMQGDRSARTDVAKEQLKVRYTKAMDALVNAYPQLRTFWTSVLRPESSLEG